MNKAKMLLQMLHDGLITKSELSEAKELPYAMAKIKYDLLSPNLKNIAKQTKMIVIEFIDVETGESFDAFEKI